MFNLFCGLTGPGNRTNAVFHGCLWFEYMLIHPLADNCIYWLWGEPTCIVREEVRGGFGGRVGGVCFCKWPHLDSPSLFLGNKQTPKLLLNTPIDGSTGYQTEPHIRAITGQTIEQEAFFCNSWLNVIFLLWVFNFNTCFKFKCSLGFLFWVLYHGLIYSTVCRKPSFHTCYLGPKRL